MVLANTGEDFYLKGIKPSTTILELQKAIQNESGIHQSRQRLFIGGEEMIQTSCLLDYFPTAYHAQSHELTTLVLRCFVPILLSTLHCPGPILSEIETRPRNDEPIINVKRRIRDKFRIEIANQRLHVHPSEMSSRFLRRPLDDTRLLSSYLSPGRGGNFLELIFVERKDQTCFNAMEKELYFRVPCDVINTRDSAPKRFLQYSTVLHYNPDTNADNAEKIRDNTPADNLPPPPPPQTPESDLNGDDASGITTPFDTSHSARPRFEPWWVTLPISIEEIIKRDPKVEDILKEISKVLNDKDLSLKIVLDPDFKNTNEKKNFTNFSLTYGDMKLSRGGKCFNKKDFIYKDLLMRREEMLMIIQTKSIPITLNSIPVSFYGSCNNSTKPVVPALSPIEPLESYDDKQVLFTSPPDPIKLRWAITPTSVIDCGARPEVDLELTGLSYTRKYGSWDIPKHEKTFVEIDVEGSFCVRDLGYAALVELDSDKEFRNLEHNEEILKKRNIKTDFENQKNKIVYYVQDKMEVVIYGPLNPTSLRTSIPVSLNKPFGSSAKRFVSERKKIFDFHQEVRKGELKNPPMPKPAPFYMRFDERYVKKTSEILNAIDPSWKDQRQLSKNVIGQWCLSRERVSDVAVSPSQDDTSITSSKLYSTQCNRGVFKDGRLFVKVQYERRIPITSSPNVIFPKSQHLDSVRNSFDFRIQAQFQISQLLEDKIDIGDKVDVKIAVRHWVSRVEHFAYMPDKCLQFESPSKGMDTTFKVHLANENWLKTIGEKSFPILELQKLSN